MKKSIVAIALAGATLSAAAGNGFFEGAPFITRAGWDYSPSFMVDQWDNNKEKVWWCGQSSGVDPVKTWARDSGGTDSFNNFHKDVIYYAERPAGGSWSAPQVVLSNMGGNFSAWENSWVCDPTVVRGAWTYKGANYGYAMYYTAGPGSNDRVQQKQYRTGGNRLLLAYSNDGKTWVKYGPVVESAYPDGANYAAGQGQAFNTNNGAAVTLFYTDVDVSGTPKYYIRESTDGETFGDKREISYAGLPATQRSYQNPAAAFAPSSNGYYFLALVDSTVGGGNWGHATGVSVYRIPKAQVYTGTWTKVVTKGNVKPTMVEPGFRTDAYGNITSLPVITIYSGCSDSIGNEGAWDLCWASAIVP